MRVAVVGAGPAGAYAAGHLLREGASVELFDRLPTPWGLVRGGVAPDHQQTKSVARTFEWTVRNPRCGLHLNVDVGGDVTHDELAAHHHAVVYATGGSGSRALDAEGDCDGAAELVGWYNGHPDHADRTFDLRGPRVAIVGNGNVALDVARVLTLGPERLATTDIADHALRAIAAGGVEEVVVLGRRGPAHAAFTSPELLALAELEGVDVVVDPGADLDPPPGAAFGTRLKLRLLCELAQRPAGDAPRRIVLRFDTTPLRITPGALETTTGTIEAGLVLRSAGYVVEPVATAPGVYATGWVRRGPTGVIGTNKHCAGEVVAQLLADDLPEPRHDGASLRALLADRCPDAIGLPGWVAIDAHERAAGAWAGRPRVKETDRQTMIEIARTA